MTVRGALTVVGQAVGSYITGGSPWGAAVGDDVGETLAAPFARVGRVTEAGFGRASGIDIHMIDSGAHAENAAAQLSRVQHPLIRAHVTPPVWGNVAAARRRGFALGSHPLVSFIDDDDVVLDMAWVDQAIDIMCDPEVAAVYPRWCGTGSLGQIETPEHSWSITHAHSPHMPYAHHLTVMRRANVEKFFADVGERAMVREADRLLIAAQARFGRLVALPAVAYRWVLRDGSARTHAEPEAIEQWACEYFEETVRRHRLKEYSRG